MLFSPYVYTVFPWQFLTYVDAMKSHEYGESELMKIFTKSWRRWYSWNNDFCNFVTNILHTGYLQSIYILMYYNCLHHSRSQSNESPNRLWGGHPVKSWVEPLAAVYTLSPSGVQLSLSSVSVVSYCSPAHSPSWHRRSQRGSNQR